MDIGHRIRNFKQHGLEEGVSTRLLIYTGMLINSGISPKDACQAAMIRSITDDADIQASINEIISAIME